MSTDGAHLAASISQIDRTVVQTPRAIGSLQAQVVEESKRLAELRRAQSAEQMQRDKVRRERDERRRQMERERSKTEDQFSDTLEDGPSLDLIA